MTDQQKPYTPWRNYDQDGKTNRYHVIRRICERLREENEEQAKELDLNSSPSR